MTKIPLKTYSEESIKKLRGLDRVRDKVSVVFGGDTIIGAFHTIKEVVANSIDEAGEGFGDTLDITYYKDKSISVRDYGRGVPIGWNENEEEWNWHLVFNELYAGAKYDEEFDEEGNIVGDYKESLGTNGMGAASTQYTSDFFNVISYREDGIYKVSFRGGYPIDANGNEVDMHGKVPPTEEQLKGVLVVEPNTTGETGTFIHWKISNEVFYNTAFTDKMFVDLLESQAHINKLKVNFTNELHGKTYNFEGTGVLDYLKSKIGATNALGVYEKTLRTKGIEENKRYDAKGDIKVVITPDIESQRLFFHNTSEMTEGVHNVAFDDAVIQFFKEVAKEHGIKRIKPSDYENNISGIILTSANTSATRFIGQTKRGVENTFIYNMVKSTVYGIIKDGYIKHDEVIYNFVEAVIRSAKARQDSEENAKQAKQIIKIVNDAEKNKKNKFDTKLRDAKSEKVEERELFIVEGDSALSSVLDARDSYSQAIVPIKGKLPNAIKGDVLDLLKNETIQELISTIGTGIEIGSSEESIFDIKKIKYSRINILTDADRDGFQIRVLLFAFFYRFMPQLLELGLVHIVESPILKYSTKLKQVPKMYYVYKLEEKEAVEAQIKKDGANIIEVGRAKGLGENNAEVMEESVMTLENRVTAPIQIDMDNRFTNEIINMLFGKDVKNERKEFILSMMGSALEMDDMVKGALKTSLDGDFIQIGEEDIA